MPLPGLRIDTTGTNRTAGVVSRAGGGHGSATTPEPRSPGAAVTSSSSNTTSNTTNTTSNSNNSNTNIRNDNDPDDDEVSSPMFAPITSEADIDASLVYALHTFAATLEGQVSVIKGDSLQLLDDSNSYWWLVKNIKTIEIGYVPAENVELPVERLARLNRHRNVGFAAPTAADERADAFDASNTAGGGRPSDPTRPPAIAARQSATGRRRRHPSRAGMRIQFAEKPIEIYENNDDDDDDEDANDTDDHRDRQGASSEASSTAVTSNPSDSPQPARPPTRNRPSVNTADPSDPFRSHRDQQPLAQKHDRQLDQQNDQQSDQQNEQQNPNKSNKIWGILQMGLFGKKGRERDRDDGANPASSAATGDRRDLNQTRPYAAASNTGTNMDTAPAEATTTSNFAASVPINLRESSMARARTAAMTYNPAYDAAVSAAVSASAQTHQNRTHPEIISVIRIHRGNVDIDATFKSVPFNETITAGELVVSALKKFRINHADPSEFYLTVAYMDSHQSVLDNRDVVYQSLNALRQRHLPGIGDVSRIAQHTEQNGAANAIRLTDDNVFRVLIHRKQLENIRNPSLLLIRIAFESSGNPGVPRQRAMRTISIPRTTNGSGVIQIALESFSLRSFTVDNFILVCVIGGFEAMVPPDLPVAQLISRANEQGREIMFVLRFAAPVRRPMGPRQAYAPSIPLQSQTYQPYPATSTIDRVGSSIPPQVPEKTPASPRSSAMHATTSQAKPISEPLTVTRTTNPSKDKPLSSLAISVSPLQLSMALQKIKDTAPASAMSSSDRDTIPSSGPDRSDTLMPVPASYVSTYPNAKNAVPSTNISAAQESSKQSTLESETIAALASRKEPDVHIPRKRTSSLLNISQTLEATSKPQAQQSIGDQEDSPVTPPVSMSSTAGSVLLQLTEDSKTTDTADTSIVIDGPSIGSNVSLSSNFEMMVDYLDEILKENSSTLRLQELERELNIKPSERILSAVDQLKRKSYSRSSSDTNLVRKPTHGDRDVSLDNSQLGGSSDKITSMLTVQSRLYRNPAPSQTDVSVSASDASATASGNLRDLFKNLESDIEDILHKSIERNSIHRRSARLSALQASSSTHTTSSVVTSATTASSVVSGSVVSTTMPDLTDFSAVPQSIRSNPPVLSLSPFQPILSNTSPISQLFVPLHDDKQDAGVPTEPDVAVAVLATTSTSPAAITTTATDHIIIDEKDDLDILYSQIRSTADELTRLETCLATLLDTTLSMITLPVVTCD